MIFPKLLKREVGSWTSTSTAVLRSAERRIDQANIFCLRVLRKNLIMFLPSCRAYDADTADIYPLAWADN